MAAAILCVVEEVIRATELGISLKGLVLPGGLRMAKGEVWFDAPILSVKPFLIPEGTICHANLTFLEEDIQAYLERKRPANLSDFQVSAKDGEITITAIARLLLPVEVGAAGTLEFTEGRLNFVARCVEAGGINAESIARPHLERLNPLIDLTGLPVRADVQSLDIGGGTVRISVRLETTAAIPRLAP